MGVRGKNSSKQRRGVVKNNAHFSGRKWGKRIPIQNCGGGGVLVKISNELSLSFLNGVGGRKTVQNTW